MKAIMRGFGLVMLSVIVLGFTGCGADNETEAAKLQKSAGPPPALPAGTTKPALGPTNNSMDDYVKNRTDPYQGTKFDPKKK